MSNKIISPIAIDMGAKNTGVYLNHFTQGKDPTESGNIEGKTIVIDSSKITWSQVNRTQKRHQIRTIKRRKLAKRLLRLILTNDQAYNLTLNQKQLDFLMGLLNRRGYNRIETTEEQENILQSKIVSDFFQPIIFDDDSNDDKNDGFLEKLNGEIIIKDDESKKRWQDILRNKVFALSGKNNSGFTEYIKNEYDKYDKDEIAELSKASTAIKNLIEKQIDNYKTGHLHRRDYVENIHKDIEKSEVLKSLFNQELTIKKLVYLIGNISNLQLRILRKYFNDKAMKSGDLWNPKTLHKLFFRWVRSWHAKQGHEKDNRKNLLALQNNKDILKIFTASDPKLSIPPYEDQNNRRPPKDLTLRLNPKSLDNALTNWEDITQLLVTKYILPITDKRIIRKIDNTDEKVDIAEGLKDNVRTKKNSDETKERQILADTLHRILDRTTLLDPYKLRWLAQDTDTSSKAMVARVLLNNHSDDQADKIISFSKRYYAEVDLAKQGLWSDNESSLFFRCETNPPHKGNIQHRLVGHILRCNFPLNPETKKSEKLEKFKEDCWNKKIKGKSTTKSLSGKIEETRKEHGNKFNYIATNIKNRQRQSILEHNNPPKEQKEGWNKYEADYKDVVEAIENTDLVAIKISAFLKHNENEKEKYNNPYSIAQLYNHLETEIRGFSKTDKWNTEENAWRDKKQPIEVVNESGEIIPLIKSNASRLTADSIRPFDGMLDRIISRQAREIARMKIKQIEELDVNKNDTFFIPIFMEQNRFKFEQDMHDIKGSKKKAKDRAKKSLKEQEGKWQDKDTRIKKNKYCPYTGEKITRGEIDHIIPQSQSKKHHNVVFNSEANLIYCSGEGNHQKGDRRYSFDQLESKYLKEIFEHSNKEKTQQEIKDFVNKLDKNDITSFHDLKTKEQNYLRHALFIQELDDKTFPILNTRYKTFVNGTQGYLGKQIRKLLQEKYPNVEVKTYQIPAYKVSQLRDTLGAYDESLKKQEKQGAFSHVVDASMVLATALKNLDIAKELQTTNISQSIETGKWLKKLLPQSIDVQHIKRRPKYRKNLSSTQIFKERLYGERFMPILLGDGKLYYGFSLDNSYEVAPLKKTKKGIKDFDKKLQKANEEKLKVQEEYFKLLKPFLYTGKKKNKQIVSGNLSDNWRYSYLSIDKIKALAHLQKCTKEVCGDKEIQQAKLLKKLHYSVEKKEIKSVLTGEKTFIKELADKKFKALGLWLPAKNQWEQLINHPVKDHNDNKTTLKKCFGKAKQIEIDNPKLKDFWETLVKESKLDLDYLKDNLLKKNDKGELSKQAGGIIPKKGFDKKIKANKKLKSLENNKLLKQSFGISFKIKTYLIPQESWDKLFEDFFHTKKIKNQNNHKQVRKVYSLPIVSSPSGGFRIKRKNPLTNKDIYQVSGTKSFSTKGYEPTLKTPILIDELSNSPNVVSLGGKQDSADAICYFDEWRDIKLVPELEKKITSLSYAIGSKDRFYIRVGMLFDKFQNLDNTISSWQKIQSEVSEPKKDKKNTPKKRPFKKDYFKKYFSSPLLGKPYSNLFIERVSAEQVIFSYIAENTSKKLKEEAYKKGTPVK